MRSKLEPEVVLSTILDPKRQNSTTMPENGFWWPQLVVFGKRGDFNFISDQGYHTHTHTHTTVLWLFGFCPGQPEWAGTRRTIHPLTPIVVIIYPYLFPPFTMIHGILPIQSMRFTVFFHKSLSKFSLVYLLAWHPPLHTPYISLPRSQTGSKIWKPEVVLKLQKMTQMT